MEKWVKLMETVIAERARVLGEEEKKAKKKKRPGSAYNSPKKELKTQSVK